VTMEPHLGIQHSLHAHAAAHERVRALQRQQQRLGGLPAAARPPAAAAAVLGQDSRMRLQRLSRRNTSCLAHADTPRLH
jgi:hypothetical protein